MAANPTLRRWAGTPGFRIVVTKNVDNGEAAQWRVHGEDVEDGGEEGEHGEVDVVYVEPKSDAGGNDASAGLKRALSPISSNNLSASPPRKRSRSVALCKAPVPDPIAQQILSMHDNGVENSDSATAPQAQIYRGAGDIFLSAGWRDRWCKCDSVNYKFAFSVGIIDVDYLSLSVYHR